MGHFSCNDAPMPRHDAFDTTLRGYDREQVDRFVETVTQALNSPDPARRAGGRKLVRETTFTVTLRGYNRAQVDEFTARALAEMG